MAIRVNMLRLRVTSDCPAAHEERPARPTTPPVWRRANCIQFDTLGPIEACDAERWPPISSTKTGSVSARPIQNRRVMSTSSGLGPVSAVAISGSSAMPQIGQVPGPDLPDLRMHRAGIDRALGGGLHWRSLASKIALRVGSKLGLAAVGAEVIIAALVLVSIRRRRWIDGHAADWIGRSLGLRVSLRGLGHVGEIACGLGGELALAGGGTETIGLAGILGAIRRRIEVHVHPADRVNHALPLERQERKTWGLTGFHIG